MTSAQPRNPRSRGTAATARTTVVTAALLLAGCAPSENEVTSRAVGGGAPTECPVDENEDVNGEIRLGYQTIPTGELLIKDQGILEACLPNATITWSQFTSGSSASQAFGSSSVDIATLGSAPSSTALSQPLDPPVDVVWVQEVIGDAESLAVRDDSINGISELAGKKTGVPFASTAHYSLQAALDRAGIAEDVELINLEPDAIIGAWGRGEIDAAWVWQPSLDELLDDGKLLVSSEETAEQGAATYDLTLADDSFVNDNPELLETWTAVQDWAVGVMNDDPDKAAESIATEAGIPEEQARSQIDGYRYLTAEEQNGEDYLGGGLAEDLEQTANFLDTQGEVDAVSPSSTYRDALSPTTSRN